MSCVNYTASTRATVPIFTGLAAPEFFLTWFQGGFSGFDITIAYDSPVAILLVAQLYGCDYDEIDGPTALVLDYGQVQLGALGDVLPIVPVPPTPGTNEGKVFLRSFRGFVHRRMRLKFGAIIDTGGVPLTRQISFNFVAQTTNLTTVARGRTLIYPALV